MSKPVKIAFGATAYGPLWRPAVDSWMRVIAYSQKELIQRGVGIIGSVGVTDRTYTHSAENRLVKDFLSDPDSTHLFMTEMDMLLPDNTVMDLLEVDQDIVSGIYFLRNGAGQPCLYRKVFSFKDNPYPMTPVSIFPTQDPFELKGCPGLGCVLIKREALERMTDPWFDLKENFYGSDMFFYTNALNAGNKVWCQPKVMCKQVDYCVVDQNDYYDRLLNDPRYAGTGYIIGVEERKELNAVTDGAGS